MSTPRPVLALVLIATLPAQARAQSVVLPPITVTAPSPVVAGSGGAAGTEAGALPVSAGSFSSVTILPRGDIAGRQPLTLGDALADRPGLSATTYAPGAASRPIIRGLDNFRVRLQENGIGTQDVSTIGEDHAVPVNPLVSDHIEVIRGPATLRYGSQAIGGVVSIESGRIPTRLPEGGYAGQILGGLSSLERGGNGAASVDSSFGDFVLHADGFATGSGDYGTPLGRQANSAARSQGGAVGLSYINDNGFVGIGYSRYSALYHIPGGEAAQALTRLDPTQDKLFARGQYRFDGGFFDALRFWTGIAQYKHNERGLDENGNDGIRATFTNREAEARIELQHAPIITPLGILTGALGTQTGIGRIGASGEAGGLLSPAQTRALAGYLFEEIDTGKGVKLQLAGRVEGARLTGTTSLFPASFLPNFSATGALDGDGNPVLAAEPVNSQAVRRAYTAKSVAFSILQDLPFDLIGSLAAQYVERAPAAAELFSRGAHDATGTFEIGNPDLKLERARTIELGLRRVDGPLRLDATGYVTRYTGFIYRRVTGVRCDVDFASCGGDGPLQQVVFNQQNAIFHGAELAGQLELLRSEEGGVFGLDAQYDFVRARFDDGTNVPRIPPHRLGGGFFWRDNGLFARLNLLHAFDQRRIAPQETTTNGYTALRAEISYTSRLERAQTGFSEITIGLRGDNLLDEQIRNAASFKKDEILLPGRTLRLFMQARF